jgi:glycerophosphoryl diester phosphodiesterase/arylsulfatase A-like enzyme
LNRFVFFIIPLLVARIYNTVIAVEGVPSLDISLLFVRGLLSDMAVGIGLGLILQPLYRKKLLFYLAWSLWVLAISFNTEHIKVNTSNVNYAFIHLALAEDFIYGSIFTVKNLLTFILFAALSAPLAIIATKVPVLQRRKIVWASVVLGLVLVLLLIPTSKLYPYWFQMNFIEENAKNIFSEPNYYLTNLNTDPSVRVRFFKRNLSGEQIIQYPTEQRNVLIVLVEGLGYDIIESGNLSFLKKLSDENLSYKNFINLQKQTNRGLYSLVCGDYPNFLGAEAKSDLIGMYGPIKPCLPEILSKNGYTTAFMQSADLRYMQKDMFASKAGFEIIIGANDFKEASSGTGWGVDDRTLYNYASQMIERLATRDNPWFMTLLTSGTHHPYYVPGITSPSLEQAVSYADSSIEEFIHTIDQQGLLKNTLVIITSDESIFSYGEGLLAELSSNHVPLVVLSPEINRQIVMEDIFTQADIMLSVLDYLNISAEEPTGRSIFRNYTDSRNLFFGNVYSRKVYSHSGNGTLYVCTEELDCTAYRNSNGLLFDSSYVKSSKDPTYISELTSILLDNELNLDKISSRYVFYEANRQYTGSGFLIGDHKFSARAGDITKWSFRIQAIDDFKINFSAAIVDPLDVSNRLYLFNDSTIVAGGKTASFKQEIEIPYDIPSIWTKITVLADGNARYKVEELSIEHIKNSERHLQQYNIPDSRKEAKVNPPVATPGDPTIFRKHSLIGHAFGEIDGHTHTNTREAFLNNYKRGRRIFEVDLNVTSDGKVVCFHKGSEETYGLTKKVSNMTHEEFKNVKILGRYTPMDIHDLIGIMHDYDDIYIVTDTKGWFDLTYFAISSLVHESRKIDPGIAKRIIPQVYDKLTYDITMSIYPFPEVIYTLEKTIGNDAEIISLLKKNSAITALTVSTNRFNPTLAQSVSELGRVVLVHTINDPDKMAYYKKRGVYGFYTDSYFESDIDIRKVE